MIFLFNADSNIQITPGLIVMATLLSIVGLAMFLIAIFYLIYWLKHSWWHRNNSKNQLGSEFAVKTMKYFGVNKNIQTRSRLLFGGYKFWNYSRNRQLLTLKYWTANRRALWTLNEAAEIGYFSTLVEKHKLRRFFYRFSASLSGLLIGLSFAMGIMVILPILMNANKSDAQINNWIWVIDIVESIVILGATFLSALWYMEVVKVMKEFLNKCVKNGDLTASEAKIISRIQKLRLLYAIVIALYNALQIIIRIMQKTQQNKK